mgnify:CR=1 FL=1
MDVSENLSQETNGDSVQSRFVYKRTQKTTFFRKKEELNGVILMRDLYLQKYILDNGKLKRNNRKCLE